MLVSPLAIPLIGTASAQAGSIRTPQSGELPDPVVAVAAAWIAKRQSLEAMIFEWQRLEKQLIKRAKTLDVAIDEARGRMFPEAAAMTALDRRMDRAHRVLETLARHASRLPAVGSEGALAKVDLGLRMQGRYCWQPYALELLERGAKELETFLAR
jgi:hypothetical protein